MGELLVVDMKAVLDQSRTGAEGSKALEAAWAKWSAQRDGQEKLEQLRSRLRSALIERTEQVVRELAAKRGVWFVVERSAVLVFAPEADITEQVIAAVDALGPLPAE